MELNHLKYFYFVAREGGFSKASRLLRVAQPALTRAVKALEDDLEVTLFERRGRGVLLTKVGNDVYRKCEIVFAQTREITGIIVQNCKSLDNSGACKSRARSTRRAESRRKDSLAVVTAVCG